MNTKKELSPYLYLFESNQFGYLAYNGLNNSFMKLNKNLYIVLEKAKQVIRSLDELDNETMSILEEKKVIITSHELEFYKNQKRFLYTADRFQHFHLNLTIAPTTACNFSCPYCFEKGVDVKTMTEETMKKTVSFIIDRAAITNNRVKIEWYGGEPLLATDVMLLFFD
jgi:uncharacterized protein